MINATTMMTLTNVNISRQYDDISMLTARAKLCVQRRRDRRHRTREVRDRFERDSSRVVLTFGFRSGRVQLALSHRG
jgi:hypothetical protein